MSSLQRASLALLAYGERSGQRWRQWRQWDDGTGDGVQGLRNLHKSSTISLTTGDGPVGVFFFLVRSFVPCSGSLTVLGVALLPQMILWALSLSHAQHNVSLWSAPSPRSLALQSALGASLWMRALQWQKGVSGEVSGVVGTSADFVTAQETQIRAAAGNIGQTLYSTLLYLTVRQAQPT